MRNTKLPLPLTLAAPMRSSVTSCASMDALAVLYPRFDIAYRALQGDEKAAGDDFSAAEAAAGKAAYAGANAASAADLANEAKGNYNIVNPNDAAAAASAPLDRAAEKEDDRRLKQANQRFTDRILRTAEPDALELYNLYQLKLKQQQQGCAPAPRIPEPPRK